MLRVGETNKILIGLSAFMGASLVTVAAAHAGAFAVREQSALYQGMSFAGAATGDHLSSMFWNSAAAAAAEGFNTESHGSIVFPGTEIEATGGALTLPPDSEDSSGKIGDPTFVPAAYTNYQVNQNLFIGLATNAQYGFATKPRNPNFAGTPIATTSEVFSINANPTVAYKVTPELTLGVGLQAMYIDLRLRSSNEDFLPGSSDREINVDDWAFGATAGVTWKPAAGTTIGIGYRSQLEVNASGTCVGGLGPSGIGILFQGATGIPTTGCDGNVPVDASLTLPDLVTASVSQRVSERVTLLGTVEWTNWSTVGEQAFFTNDGVNVDVFPLGYEDGWFFALGAEYEYTPFTTLRAGLAYELSPIDDEIRNVSLPDNDRIWASIGATTRLTENIEIDLAYTHIFVEDGDIDLSPALTAESTGDLDIVSASFKYSWGGSEPALEPLK